MNVKADPREAVVSLQDPQHHVTPVKTLFAIFGALMILTVITVVASGIDFGVFNTTIALAIAGIKATLVILWFMHVKYSTRAIWVVVLGSLLWLGVLFVLTFADYASRGWNVF